MAWGLRWWMEGAGFKMLGVGFRLAPGISSGRVSVIITRAQKKILHAWITSVVVNQYLVQNGRKHGPSEYFSQKNRRD